MSQKQDRFNKRRLRSSYMSVVVSMTLVLFLMGLLSTVLFHSKAIANQVQENIAFTVLLKPDSKQIMVKQFQRQLKLSEHVKNTEFISKNEYEASRVLPITLYSPSNIIECSKLFE